MAPTLNIKKYQQEWAKLSSLICILLICITGTLVGQEAFLWKMAAIKKTVAMSLVFLFACF